MAFLWIKVNSTGENCTTKNILVVKKSISNSYPDSNLIYVEFTVVKINPYPDFNPKFLVKFARYLSKSF